jgi:hypothetical protein
VGGLCSKTPPMSTTTARKFIRTSATSLYKLALTCHAQMALTTPG